jgi:hypothetical protein
VPNDDPPDDDSIGGDERLVRRISPLWAVPDGAGGTRVASAAFQDLTDDSGTTALSVHRLSLLDSQGLTPVDLLADFDGYGLVAFKAAEARQLGLGVVPAELPDEGPAGMAHAHVHGKKTKPIKSALAKNCERLVWPF